MKRGTSFPEIMIALLIISTALVIFLKIAGDYIRTLVFAKEMFVLNSTLQEKYQLLIAYRNKMLERDFTAAGPPVITETLPSGNFCLYFNPATSKINISSPPCWHKFLNNNDPNINYIVNVINSGDLSTINISASSTKPFKLEVNLGGFLTRWHPLFQ